VWPWASNFSSLKTQVLLNVWKASKIIYENKCSKHWIYYYSLRKVSKSKVEMSWWMNWIR
jgi:hypothetical protein